MIALLAALLAVITAPYTPASYACDGSTATYQVTFPYSSTSDLMVTSTTAGGTATTLVLTTDYTLNFTSTQSTATLTLLSPATKCPSGSTLKIARNRTRTQPYGFRAQTNYSPALHETAYDSIEMQVQELSFLGSADVSGTGVIPTTYGSASLIPILTINSAGRVTSGSTTGLSFANVGGVIGTGQMPTNLVETSITAPSSTTLSLIGNAAATSGVATIHDNSTAQTSGTIASFRTGGVEKAIIDFSGNIFAPGFLPYTNGSAFQGVGRAASTNGIATIFDNGTPQTTGLIASFRTGAVEKAAVDAAGFVYGTAFLPEVNGNSARIIGQVGVASGNPAVTLDNNAGQSNGSIVSFRTGGVEKSSISITGDYLTQGWVIENATNASLVLEGNRSAADTNADVILNGRANRTAGAIASFQNNSVEKSQVDAFGVVHSDELDAYHSGTPLTLKGAAIDGSSAVATVLDNINALNTAGAKITSFRSAGSEKLFISKDGSIGLQGTVAQQGVNASISIIGNRSAADANADVVLNGQVNRTAGKIASFQNNSVEKASVANDGTATFDHFVATNGLLTSSGSLPIEVRSQASTGTANASGGSIILNTANTLSTLGDLIASFQNAGTQKVSIDKDGRITLGSVTFANLGTGTTANGTLVYCSDCTIGNPCASAGSGAIAKRINNAWVCN